MGRFRCGCPCIYLDCGEDSRMRRGDLAVEIEFGSRISYVR